MKYVLLFSIGSLTIFSTFLAGCMSAVATSEGNCGVNQEVKASKTLTINNDEILLQTGAVASGTSSCPASFHLFWNWANSNRAFQDSTMPPLVDLPHSFHVNSDNLSYPGDTPAPTRTKNGYYSWSIEFEDHNNSDTAASNFYIKTYLGSNAAADSVSVSARVDYYNFNK